MIEVFGHFIRSVEMLKQGKTPFQRFLAVLCAGAMLYSMMPAQVFAEDLETGKPQTTAVTEQAPAATPTVTPVASPAAASQANSPAAASPAASPAESQESTQAPATESDPVPAPVMPLADPVNSITLNQQDVTLTSGGQESAVLEATLDPATANDDVAWESSEPGIVKVEVDATDTHKATVTMLQLGEAVITATCGGQQATCTVKAEAGHATGVTITNKAEIPAIVYPAEQESIQLTATTAPQFCLETLKWSVASTDGSSLDGVITIDDEGVLTIGNLAQDSYEVTVTAQAGEQKDSVTFIVAKKDDVITFPAGQDSMVYGDTLFLNATAASSGTIKYEVTDDSSTPAGASLSNENKVSVTSAGIFTVTATTKGNGAYKPATAQLTVTVTQKKLKYTFDDSISLSKDSDGTVQLTNANMDALKNAFTLNQGDLVGSDAVSLDVDLTNVQYGSAAVGQTTIDLSAVKLTLTGTDAQKYTPPTVSGSIAATINPVEPGRNEASMQAGQYEQRIKVGPDTLAAFAAGTREDGFASRNYWYGVNGVPVTLAQGCDLVAVNEDGTAGASLVTDVNGQLYFSAESGTDFYAVYNNIYYGPYTLTYQQDTTGPKLVLDEVKASKNDGETDEPKEDELLFGVKADYTIIVTDDGSGVDSDEVYYIVSEAEPDYNDLSSGWKKADAKWFGDGYTFTVEAPKSGVLYVMASDLVSNRSDENFHALVLEEDVPSLTVESNGNALNSGDKSTGYAADYDLTITAADSGNGTTNKQSGIQKVEYELSWKTYWLGAFQVGKNKTGTLYSQEPPATLDAITGEYLSKETTQKLSDLLDEEEYNGEYTLTLTAYDFCGNSTTFTYTFLMDSMEPEITVAMNGGNASGNTYYYKADNCGLSVHFADDNLTGSTCEATLTNTTSGKSAPKSMVATGMTCDITFTADEVKALEDGTVTLTVSVTDGVGNKQTAFVEKGNTGVALNKDRTEASFVLDTTAPVLKKVALDPAGKDYITSEKTIYYNDTFTATFKVDEANYDAGKVASASTVSGSENALAVELNADTPQAIDLIVTRADNVDNAVYTLGITMEDKAGNKLVLDGTAQFTGASSVTVTDGTATLTNEIVLDTVAPRLVDVVYTKGNEYKNANDEVEEVYYNGSFDTSFTILDKNYDSQKASVSVTGNALYSDETLGKTSESSVPGTDADTYVKTVTVHDVGENGATVKASHTVYKINLTATDKAGNVLVSGNQDLTVDKGAIALPDRIMDNVAPVMDISHSAYTGPERYDGVAYYNDTISTTFKISDDSQDAHNVYYILSKVDSAAEEKTEVPFAAESDEKRYDTTYEAPLEIAADKEKNKADGTYFYTVKGTDKAGNALVVNSEVYENGVEILSDKDPDMPTPYTCASDAMDTVAPTATMSYTELDKGNVYATNNPEGEYAYYNKDFEATFTFEDTYGTAGNSYGLDQTKLTYEKYLNGKSVEKHELGDESVGVDAAKAEASYKVTAEAGVENDDYTFAAYGIDKAGNPLVVYEPNVNKDTLIQVNSGTESYTSPYHKVLDTKAPTYTLALSEPTNDLSIAVDSNNRAYHNETISATFTVEDVNLDNGRVKADVLGKTGTDFNYETADVEWDNLELAQGQMVNDGSLTLGPIEATADGVYRFQIQGEDRAGNPVVPASSEANKQEYQKAVSVGEGKYWTYPQVRDTLAPVLTVNLNDGADFYTATLGEASEKVNTYYNVTQNMPYRSATGATGTLTKADCSPTSVVYSIDSTTQSQSNNGSPYSYENLSLNFSGEQIFSIQTLSIADRAGNTSTMPAKTNKIYLDATAPDVDELAPTVSIAAKESGEGRSVAGTDLFNTGVTVRATVTDPGEGVRSSGLYQVYYKVLVNGDDWTDKVGVSGKGVVGQAGVLGYGTGGSEFVSDGSDQPITSQDVIDFSFDAETFNYNDVKIYVWAEDNAGNELTEAQAAHYYFGIDVTTPTIEVSYDNNNAQNEKYFKEDRVATVVVTERNFDPSNTAITTETSNISGWTYAAGSLPNGDDDTWTCTVSYTEDGDYTFDVTTTDLVGHKAEEADYGDSVAPKEFTIDKTAPVIQISFNNNDVRNGKYYDAARTATISIEEHNFSADGATVTTTANIQEGSVAAPAPSGWSSNGDTNTATVPFNEDGNYTMHVEFVDLAGNEAEPEDVDEFVVDTTAPELEITGVEDHMAYNGDVAPIITYHDINYDASSAVVAIQGVKHPSGENLNGTRTEDAFGGSFVCDNIEAVKANDDVYTATGSVSDMAGNETEVQVVFSVNRFGSTYMIADETQPLLDNYYTNTPQDLHVIEINVDSQVSNRVTTSLNGEVNTLQEGTDYTVAESVPGWHQYDYTILAANFTIEGIYDVTLSSEDEAGNTSSNRAVKEDDGETSDLPITFVVDMTPPVNVITGVDNDEQYIAVERTIVVNYDDNIGMAGMTLYVNDEKVAEYDGEDLQNAAGSIQYTAKSANRWQSFKVVSTDLAGNTSEESTVRYLLTDNLLVQYFNNKPIFYGSLAILAALIVLIIVFIKRKKQQPVNKA